MMWWHALGACLSQYEHYAEAELTQRIKNSARQVATQGGCHFYDELDKLAWAIDLWRYTQPAPHRRAALRAKVDIEAKEATANASRKSAKKWKAWIWQVSAGGAGMLHKIAKNDGCAEAPESQHACAYEKVLAQMKA
jgi:hypothetical protein